MTRNSTPQVISSDAKTQYQSEESPLPQYTANSLKKSSSKWAASLNTRASRLVSLFSSGMMGRKEEKSRRTSLVNKSRQQTLTTTQCDFAVIVKRQRSGPQN